MRGVVAAGHPLTAEAGADVLRAGGNAVDAAVAAVLMSFVTEAPLTGPGAGGFMVVHARGENHLLDFFVAAPGLGLEEREPGALVPIDVRFSEDAVQRFNVGAASCGAYGTTAGLAETLRRFGTRAASATSRPRRRGRRARGSRSCRCRRSCCDVLAPIVRSTPGVRGDVRARRAAARARATPSGCPSWATCSTGWAPRGPASSTRATWRPR